MLGLVFQLGLPVRSWKLARAARREGGGMVPWLSLVVAAVALVVQAVLLAALLVGVPALFASTEL